MDILTWDHEVGGSGRTQRAKKSPYEGIARAYDAHMSESSSRVMPIVVAVIASLLSFLMLPLALVLPFGVVPGRVMDLIAEGGWGSWVVLLLTVLSVLVTTGLGGWLAAREKAWSWLPALMPFLLGLGGALFEMLGMDKALGAVGGESVDPAQKARIVAAGTSEATTLSLLAGLGICVVLSSCAVVFGARSLSRVPRGGFGLGLILALVAVVLAAPGVAAIASLVPSMQLGIGIGWMPALATVVGVVLAGVALGDKTASPEALGKALGDLAIAATYGVVGVWTASTVVHAAGFRAAMGAASGYSVDPSQVTQIVAEGVTRMDAAFGAHLIYLAPVLLVSIACALPSLRHVPGAFRSGWAGFFAPAFVGCIVLLMFVTPRVLRTDRVLSMRASLIPADVEFVEVGSAHEFRGPLDLVVGRNEVRFVGQRVLGTAQLEGAGCAEVARKWHDSMFASTSAIAVDANVPTERVTCLLRALGEAKKETRVQNVAVVVHYPRTVAVRPPWDQLAIAQGAVDVGVSMGNEPRLVTYVHMARDVWDVRYGSQRETLRGAVPERSRALRSRFQEDVGVTVNPGVPFGDVVQLGGSALRRRPVLLSSAESEVTP